MKQAPSTFTAIAVFAVFLLFGFATRALACTDCICFEDKFCSSNACDENLTANCTRTVFSPACTGNYSFTTHTTCPDEEDCDACQSCANLFRLDGVTEYFIANCHTSQCTNGNCFYSCSLPLPNIPLDATKTYVMYTCKIPCPGGHSCEDCNENCAAYACLSMGVTTCTP